MKTVLVTTEFRGVFFGYLEDGSKLPEQCTLRDARNCIYWSSDCRGFLGLATIGVTPNCKIGMKVDKLTLYKITSVTDVSKEAEKTWTETP